MAGFGRERMRSEGGRAVVAHRRWKEVDDNAGRQPEGSGCGGEGGGGGGL